MSKLHVLTYPNKTLKKVSKPVKEVSKSIQQLAKEMFETMYAENGIGLAAVQVGELIRLIIVDVPLVDSINPEKITPDPIALVNPQIATKEGTIQYDEGCLSCPELIVKVDRSAKIKVHYLNLEGKKCELEVTGLKGVCIQHEMDHTKGILLVDKLNNLQREDYLKQRIRTRKSDKDIAAIM